MPQLDFDVYANLDKNVEQLQQLRLGDRYLHFGLSYSNLGFGIECVMNAWMKANYLNDCDKTGIPVKSTTAWSLMLQAQAAIDTMLDNGQADLDTPYRMEPDGANPWYTPLQYLYVLQKQSIFYGFPHSWKLDLLEKLVLHGASCESPDWQTDEYKAKAKEYFACIIDDIPSSVQNSPV